MSLEYNDSNEGVDRLENLEPHCIELPEPHLATLPDVGEVLVSGNPEGCKELNHLQGENLDQFHNTCGLVACEGVLRQFGIPASEGDLLERAVSTGHCDVVGGYTSMADQVALLESYGIPAHTEHQGTLAGLADRIEHGQSVIIEVNSGVLWNDANHYGNGETNHAVLVTGIARDPETGSVQGCFINDSATGESGQFVSADALQSAYVDTGGKSVVTDFQEGRDTERTIGDWIWYDGHWISV